MLQNTHSRQILRYRLDYNLIYIKLIIFILYILYCEMNRMNVNRIQYFIFFTLRIYIQKYKKKKIMKIVENYV